MVFLPSERAIPSELQQQFADTDWQAILRWQEGDYLSVERLYNKELRLVQRKENEVRHPLHKGHPLHNIGMSLVAQKRSEEAVCHILLAYVEDALSAKTHEEDEIDRAQVTWRTVCESYWGYSPLSFFFTSTFSPLWQPMVCRTSLVNRSHKSF